MLKYLTALRRLEVEIGFNYHTKFLICSTFTKGPKTQAWQTI